LEAASSVLTDASADTITNTAAGSRAVIMYNNQYPQADVSSKGHTKGVFSYEADGGFWLVHSVPRFPYSPAEKQQYSFPDYAVENGQTFLCISLAASELDKVGKALGYNNPNIYVNDVPAALQHSIPRPTATSEAISLTSRGGMQFTAFAKSKAFGKDLYSQLVGPHFQSDMIVETWMRPYEYSHVHSCDTSHGGRVALNARVLNFDPPTLIFHETKDHSKWAITTAVGQTVLCVGDINHNAPQFKRGGGTVCFSHPAAHSAIKNMVACTDLCPVNHVIPAITCPATTTPHDTSGIAPATTPATRV